MDERQCDQEVEGLLQQHGAGATQVVADTFIAAVRSGDEDATAYWLRVMLLLKDRLQTEKGDPLSGTDAN